MQNFGRCPRKSDEVRLFEAPFHECRICACPSSQLTKIDEDVIKTLEEMSRRFERIETVREKFTCRDCEKISQPPAPFHATPRGFVGPQLMATILFDKFGMRIPLNCQRVRSNARRSI